MTPTPAETHRAALPADVRAEVAKRREMSIRDLGFTQS